MSTWQSVIASADKLDTCEARTALKESGLAVFIAPGILGTILGVLLYNSPDVTANNVISKLVQMLPLQYPFVPFFVAMALLASIMAMIDGVLLAAAYSLICDVFYRDKSLDELDKDENLARKLVILVRVFLAVVAIAGSAGVYILTEHYHIDLFNVVYILIICQLSLTGPVLLGLTGKRGNEWMSLSIILGLVVGFASFFTGIHFGSAGEWLFTGAGAFTMIASYVTAQLLRSEAK